MSTDFRAAMEYGREVMAGKIDVCKYTALAVERHFRDLKDGPKRGLFYCQKSAEHMLDFFGFLRHSKGEWAGRELILEPWQAFWLAVLFGWMGADGFRRFRTAYEEVPRKNGKSTKLAGVGLYLFFADGEGGAEVYTAATKRDQALITHREATRMVQKSPSLRARIGVTKNNLHHLATASMFEPLGADADTADGLNVHGAIVDELHAHKHRDLWDVLETATGSRTQSLLYAITTAGFNQYGICYELREYLTKILEGTIVDDTFWGVIYTADEGDDWQDEATWRKANPNYGISVKPEDIARLAKKAAEIPAAQNNFLTKRLNIWTQQETKWLDMDTWSASGSAFDEKALEGRPCFGGLDLSTKIDLSSFALVFPPFLKDPLWYCLSFFWVPEDNMMRRARKDRVPYDVWAKQGLIKATEGNVVDYEVIRNDIRALGDRFAVQDVGFDPWNATQIATQLSDDGFQMVEMRQGPRTMGEPSKELEALILSKRFNHGGNAVLKWCASNVTIRTDANGNYMPDKGKSTERIDGVVAAVMAIGRAINQDGGQTITQGFVEL